MRTACPEDSAAVARSDAANAAQVICLQARRSQRDIISETVHRLGSYALAGHELGLSRHLVRHRAIAAGRPLSPEQAHKAGHVGPGRTAFETGLIPREVAQRGPRWRAAYGEAWDAAKAAGQSDGWAQYYATRAADAACVGEAG